MNNAANIEKGALIRAWDHEPMEGRKDRFIEGVVIAIESQTYHIHVVPCAEFDVQSNKADYMDRMRHASAAIDYCEQIHGRRPWVHLMRGLGVLHELIRFESADSTNVARNHSRYKDLGDQRCKVMADRISSKIHAVAYAAPFGRTFDTSNFN